MFPTTIAGSLPKPSWLAEPDKLWPQWRLTGADLAAGKLDATLVPLKLQEDAATDVVTDGVDVIQFDEPAFNVYMKEVSTWGVEALHRCIEGLKCRTAVHICYGYGIKANVDWKATLGGEWRQYEETFPALAASRLTEVSLECIHSKVPIELLSLLQGKDVQIGVIDVSNDAVETA